MSDGKGVDKMTVGVLRELLSELPVEFDDYNLVNGEVFTIPEEDGSYKFYARVDKAVMNIQADESSKELCFYHQTEDDIDDIIAQVQDGDTEES